MKKLVSIAVAVFALGFGVSFAEDNAKIDLFKMVPRNAVSVAAPAAGTPVAYAQVKSGMKAGYGYYKSVYDAGSTYNYNKEKGFWSGKMACANGGASGVQLRFDRGGIELFPVPPGVPGGSLNGNIRIRMNGGVMSFNAGSCYGALRKVQR